MEEYTVSLGTTDSQNFIFHPTFLHQMQQELYSCLDINRTDIQNNSQNNIRLEAENPDVLYSNINNSAGEDENVQKLASSSKQKSKTVTGTSKQEVKVSETALQEVKVVNESLLHVQEVNNKSDQRNYSNLQPELESEVINTAEVTTVTWASNKDNSHQISNMTEETLQGNQNQDSRITITQGDVPIGQDVDCIQQIEMVDLVNPPDDIVGTLHQSSSHLITDEIKSQVFLCYNLIRQNLSKCGYIS